MTRPGPLLWLRYLVTSDLPDRYDEWVLHDTTCRTWLLRHTLRFLTFIAPIAVLVLVFLPAPIGLRLGCVAVGLLGSAAISFGYTVEGAERRVEKAGYPYGRRTHPPAGRRPAPARGRREAPRPAGRPRPVIPFSCPRYDEGSASSFEGETCGPRRAEVRRLVRRRCRADQASR